MLASGCAALGYQIVWTHQATLWLGHEGAAALAVVAAFFGGLALGAGCLGAAIDRSARPGLWYAGCEAAMASWGLLLAWGLEPASRAINTLLGPAPSAAWQAGVTFGGTFLLLLPATLAMGATLPAMERLLAQLQKQSRASGANLAALYAGNTLGGVLGVLGVAFWLVPQWGLSAAALACALLNAACALAVLWLLPPQALPAHPTRAATATKVDGPTGHDTASATLPPLPPLSLNLALTLALTGFLGIGYEVIVLRVLSQVAENTVYTFALLLAVYLIGTALGAAGWARWGPSWRVAEPARRAGLLMGLSLACALSGGALWLAPWFKAGLTLMLGGSFAAALAAEALLATIAFGLPTLAMGALFSHLCEAARAQRMRLGTALALNTAGAALAPVLLVAGLAAGLGAKLALLTVVGGYLALALAVRRRPGPAGAAAAALVAALAFAPPLAFVDLPSGGAVLSHREGVLGAVSVVQDAAGVRVLRINNRQQEGSNISALADARQALLPLLLHPAPRRALFLGLGTGVTAQAAALDPGLDVLAVELLPEVVQAASFFGGVLGDPAQTLKPRVQVADARRFVRTTAEQWDVIVSDNFHPARAGSGALYTVEHFEAVRARLAPGGSFCQWLPLHQMDLATLRSIVGSFLAVNPHGAALLATNSLLTPVLGLWAQRDAVPLDVNAAAVRLQRATPAAKDFGFADPWALLGSFVAGPASLARFAAGAPLNTDDHPVVSYLAPRATYAPEATPAARLLGLLQQWSVGADELLPLAHDSGPDRDRDRTQHARLAAYVAARKVYLTAGVGVQVTADPAQMLAQVREPLLQALRTSADFSPAYEPLLRLALALKAREPMAAQALLEDLTRLAPQQPRAWQALQQQAGR